MSQHLSFLEYYSDANQYEELVGGESKSILSMAKIYCEGIIIFTVDICETYVHPAK